MNLQQRLANALYAQAIVDATGNPFEFQGEIDPLDVSKYANDTKTLVISDDTQMAMFGFEAINNLKPQFSDAAFNVAFTNSYVDWYATQTGITNNNVASRLLSFPEMWSVQAPGNTCLSALSCLKQGLIVKNDSMGCGSVMRLLPLVMLLDLKYSLQESKVIELAQMTGAITHKHAENDVAIETYMKASIGILSSIIPNHDQEVTDISQLGEGWIALEAVQMAVWAYCKAESFDELMEISIAHDGDSDSVGAIAGSLWGLSGREVPQRYIDKLDALAPINHVIDELIMK